MTVPSPSSENGSLPQTVPSFMCDERRSIAARLGVSEEQLKKAVRAVGSRLTTIRIYLGK